MVQSKIRHSNEALEAMTDAGGKAPNARALRRTAKRYEALATASPFVLATIGFCNTYLYCKGTLCYILGDQLRVLDLRHSGCNELVINIPGLLGQVLPDVGENSQGTFQILYCAEEIISCIYRSTDPGSSAWLIAFHSTTLAILLFQELEVTNKIFARHNKKYLYYGTHSDIGADGFRKWVLSGYDFEAGQWFEHKIHLRDMVGSEINSTICFEFYRGYLYGLASQTSFENQEIDWTSFYHCIRFPLSSPCPELVQKADNRGMWRRQHREGPIDDRWSSLNLDIDESTGELGIVEARREWYLGSSKSQRTYYKTPIYFPDDEDLLDGYLQETYASSSSAAGSSELPNDPLLRLRTKEDNPTYAPPLRRLPQNVHNTRDGEHRPTFTLAKSLLRTYHTFCNTFIDFVDDPLPSDWTQSQRLRLRAGARYPKPPLLDDASGLARQPSADLETAMEEIYKDSEIKFWPPAQEPNAQERNKDVEELYEILNPTESLGGVTGMGDERGIVYTTGLGPKLKTLVFIGFDPGVRLEGLRQWPGVLKTRRVEGDAGLGCRGDDSSRVEKGKGKEYVDPEESKRAVVVERKGNGQRKACATGTSTGRTAEVHIFLSEGLSSFREQEKEGTVTTGGSEGTGKGVTWAWMERAKYRDINQGFYFGRDKLQPLKKQ